MVSRSTSSAACPGHCVINSTIGGDKIRIRIHRHLAERPGSGDDHQSREHQDEEALLQGELNDAMDHRGSGKRSPLLLQRILELQEQAAISGNVFAFLQAAGDLRTALVALA